MKSKRFVMSALVGLFLCLAFAPAASAAVHDDDTGAPVAVPLAAGELAVLEAAALTSAEAASMTAVDDDPFPMEATNIIIFIILIVAGLLLFILL